MNNFEEIQWSSVEKNASKMFGTEWTLIAAGNTVEGYNMMTASWGGFGYIWEQPVAFIFIRPQRYTYEFVDKNKHFTISFIDDKKILQKLGSNSGRVINKMNIPGLTPFNTCLKNIAFQEAKLIIECEKLYKQQLNKSCFIEPTIPKRFYFDNDFHFLFVGSILHVYKNKQH